MTGKPKKEEPNQWRDLVERLAGGKASWNWADSEELLAAVVTATEDGAALLLSRTSDGGALVIQIWNGTDRHKLYPTSSAELNEMLAAIAAGAN